MKMPDHKLIFETTDPLDNVVSLSKGTWDNHILKAHVELNGHELRIQQTVEEPNYIKKDKDFTDTRLYYKLHNSMTLNEYGKYIKVAVNSGTSAVKTAFITDRLHEDEKIIYNDSTKT